MSYLYACSLTGPALDTVAAAVSTAKLALMMHFLLYGDLRGDEYVLAGDAKLSEEMQHGKGIE